jgi:hypothetical protein
MSAQYPISNQNQQVDNQQGPEYTVGEQQSQDLNNSSSDLSSPEIVDSHIDPHNGSIVIVHSLEADEASIVDTTKRRPSLFRRGPYFPLPIFRRRSSEISPAQVVDAVAQLSEKTDATVSPTVPSPDQRKSRRPSFINVTWFRKKSKDNVVLEAVEEKEIPRAKHVEDVKALYEEQEQARNTFIRGVGFTKPL